MRVKNKKECLLFEKIIVKDDEGGIYSTYSHPKLIRANIYPASGKLQGEIYGQRLNYILNMLYDGEEDINEDDGIGVYLNDKPDYKVISKKIYSNHMLFEIEKI